MTFNFSTIKAIDRVPSARQFDVVELDMLSFAPHFDGVELDGVSCANPFPRGLGIHALLSMRCVAKMQVDRSCIPNKPAV